MAGFELMLHGQELLREGRGFGQVDSGEWRQTEDALLGEVLDTHAAVSRPLVSGRVRLVVDGGKGELVQPAREVAVGVHIARRQARP